MNRLPHVSPLPGLVAFAALWLMLAAVAQAQTHTHRHARPPVKAPVKRLAAKRAAPKRVAAKSVAGAPSRSGPPASAAALAVAAARGSRAGHKRVAHARLRPAAVHAHMAGDPAVSIVDFSFSPGTTTIHVGDTITWTNTGKQPHSATADNHSFDTGLLRTGQSGSHTFNTAGTFTYFCIVHPYMKGTVVVLAATTTTSNNSTTTTPTTGATTTTSGQTLPFTGTNDLAAFAIGLLLVGAGFGLRSRSRRAAEE